jgi:hypothetical protein
MWLIWICPSDGWRYLVQMVMKYLPGVLVIPPLGAGGFDAVSMSEQFHVEPPVETNMLVIPFVQDKTKRTP